MLRIIKLNALKVVFKNIMEEIWKDIKDYEGVYQLSNLEWCTASENRIHALNTGLQRKNTGLKGKLNSKSRPVLQMSDNGEVIKRFDSMGDAQGSTGVDRASINRVVLGNHKTAGGYKWKYDID